MKHIFQQVLLLTILSFCGAQINAQCKASFNYSDSGTMVFFSNTSSGGSAFFWTFGDNTADTSMNPVHTYNANGSYYVCLIISDSGCSDTFCTTITLPSSGGGCSAKFIDSLSGRDAFFKNLSTGTSASTKYFWSFGDGTGSTSQNPSHSFNGTGPYYVCLTITDSASQCSSSSCQYISFQNSGGGCQAQFIDSTSGTTSYFYNTSSGTTAATSYFWSFGDSTTSNQENPNHTYNANGLYTVCLTISDSNCSDTYCYQIKIGNSGGGGGCSADYKWNSQQKMVTFANTSSRSANTTYSWSFGDGTGSSQENPTHTYSSFGTYTVCLVITDVNCADTFCSAITISNKTMLGGSVTLGNAQTAAYPAMVWAIVYDSTGGGTLTAIDSTYTDSMGYYVFDLVSGDYLIKAALLAGSSQYSNYMPTYHQNKLYWDSANLITLNQDTFSINIYMVSGNNPGGIGFIGGKVSQGANKTGNVGDPLSGIYILLMNSNNKPVAYTYSDISGNYSFDKLAYGTYTVISDIVGKKASSLQVTIDAQKPKITDVNVEVNSLSVVVQTGISFSQELNPSNGIYLYPNPVKHYVYIEKEDLLSYQFELFDISGQRLKTQTISHAINPIHIADLTSGIYFIRLTGKDGQIFSYKTIKE